MRKLLLAMALTLAFAWSSMAQNLDDVSVGGGIFLLGEDEPFTTDDAFASIQLEGFDLPLEANTGIGVEFQFPRGPAISVAYTVWSLNRIEVPSWFPGSDRLYSGVDLKIASGSNIEQSWDFDRRVVVGALLATVRRHPVIIETYFLTKDDQSPIAFLVKIGMGR